MLAASNAKSGGRMSMGQPIWGCSESLCASSSLYGGSSARISYQIGCTFNHSRRTDMRSSCISYGGSRRCADCTRYSASGQTTTIHKSWWDVQCEQYAEFSAKCLRYDRKRLCKHEIVSRPIGQWRCSHCSSEWCQHHGCVSFSKINKSPYL